jgi:nucleoside-diphosphate-sugar epimerase
MQILLIGSEGTVGSALFTELSKIHSVIPWNHQQELFSLSAEWIEQEKIDAVINCASFADRKNILYQAGGPADWTNVEAARHLTEILFGKTTRLIHLSTAEVHGAYFQEKDCDSSEDLWIPRTLMSERSAYKPRTVYGKSKLMGEFLVESHPYSTVLRFSHFLGESDHPRMSWIRNLVQTGRQLNQIGVQSPKERIEIEVQGSGREFVDPLHLSDLVELVERVLLSPPEASCGVKFLVGGGRDNLLSLRTLLRWISEDSGVELSLKAQSQESPEGLGYCASNELALERLGWSPQFRLREWVRTQVSPSDDPVTFARTL